LSFIGPQHSANISNSPIPPYVAPGSAQNMHNRTVQMAVTRTHWKVHSEKREQVCW